MSRWDVGDAVKASDLAPLARLVMWTLLSHADTETAVIPDRYSPSLTALQRATGMSRSSVVRQLDGLETGGWVVRSRPPIADQLSARARTGYTLRVPDPDRSPALVPHGDQSKPSTSPRRGLVLVPHRDSTGPTQTHDWSHGGTQCSSSPGSSGGSSAAAAPELTLDRAREHLADRTRSPQPLTIACRYCRAPRQQPCRGLRPGYMHSERRSDVVDDPFVAERALAAGGPVLIECFVCNSPSGYRCRSDDRHPVPASEQFHEVRVMEYQHLLDLDRDGDDGCPW